jgi:diguanylate cyclase (GGDEF)-like protein
MGKLFKNLSLASRSLRHELRIAFSLMSVIPILVCIYLFFSYNPSIEKIPFSNIQIPVSMAVSVIISIIGYLVAKQIVDPILEITSEARNIVKGEFDKTIDVYREDELGELGDSLNQLTRRIRDNMDELRNYGERTKQINTEINKHVVVLSGLLQVSNLITQGANLKEIYEISISKLAQLKNSAWTILVISDQYRSFNIAAQYGITDQMQTFLLKDGLRKIFDSVILNKNGWIIGGKQTDSENDEFVQIFDTANMVFVPVYRHTKIVGFLGAGNSKVDNMYDEEDLELIRVFAKQISIGIENDYLSHRLLKLEIKDSLTGLYNKNFIINRLEEEIRRAMIYQRPCAFLLLTVDKFGEFLKSYGQLASEEMVKKVAKIVEETCSDIDKIARYSDHDFAIVLPEKNKKQSIVVAEEIKDKITQFFSKNKECSALSVSGSISENPIDGNATKILVEKAEKLLELAKGEGNTIKL